MAMEAWDRPVWQVKIRATPNGPVVGGGVLVTDRHVITCAHVVSDSSVSPQFSVYIEFQYTASTNPIPAQVISGGWFPGSTLSTADIAVLRLESPPPDGCRPPPLRRSTIGVTDHRFRTYGYPKGHDTGGVPARGNIVGPAESEWLQLQADSTLGYALEPGFSGSAVWDDDIHAVIGIVVTRDKIRGRAGDPRTGYAIPVEVLARYWPPLEAWVGWRLTHDPDLGAHWSPRSRGVDRESRRGWFFTGRKAALRDIICRLIGEDANGAVQIVTGGPGSGKSAVLGRIVTLSDPELRSWIEKMDPEQFNDMSIVPPIGLVTVAVRCTGLGLAEVCQRISDYLIPTQDPAELIERIIAQGKPATLVIDALDEAINDQEARAIASKLLRPLAFDGASSGIRAIAGTRPGHHDELLRALGGQSVINLDDIHYFDLADLSAYTRQCLLAEPRPGNISSYKDHYDVAEVVADAIAERAQPSFLVAGLTARTRAGEHIVDISKNSWREVQRFPQDVAESMADYLSRLPNADRALQFLVPLAFSQQPGLPIGLWEQFITEYTGIACKHSEMEGFLRGAASYVVEQRTIEGAIVYRLFHQAFADHIRSKVHEELVQETFVEILRANAIARGGWPTADSYVRQNAATHAAAAGNGAFDRLLVDAGFLVAMDRTALLRAFGIVQQPTSLAIAALYRSEAHKLSDHTGLNAAYLELAAYSNGDSNLAAKIRDLRLDQPFTPVFVIHARFPSRLTLRSNGEFVTALSWGSIDGRAALASAQERFDYSCLRTWDPISGEELFEPIPSGTVHFLAWGELERRPLLASATLRSVQIWSPADGQKVAGYNLGEDYNNWIRGLSWGKVKGQTSLAIATAGSLHFWNPISNKVVEKVPYLVDSYRPIQIAAWGKLSGRTVVALVAGWSAQHIDIWDPSTEDYVKSTRVLTGSVSALAWVRLKNRDALAVAAGGRVMIWDPLIDAQPILIANSASGVSALSWLDRDAGGLLAIANQDGTVRIYDPASETALSSFKGHYGVVRLMKWHVSDDVHLLATSGEDRALHVWNPGSSHGAPSTLDEDTWVSAVAWGKLGNQRVLATGGRYDGAIRVWEPGTATSVAVFAAHKSAVHALAWGEIAGHSVLASGGDDAMVRISDPQRRQEICAFTGHRDAINSVAWSKLDGRVVLASASDDGSVFVWDALEGNRRVLLQLDGLGQCVLDWSRSKRLMLAIGGANGYIETWNPLSLSKNQRFRAAGAIRALACYEFKGRSLLAAATNAIYDEDSDAIVQIWDTSSGQEVRRFSVAGEIVSSLVWGQVDQRCVLACGTEDGVVQLYDMDSDDYSVFYCDAAVLDIDMTKEGLLAIGHSRGIDAVVLTNHWRVLGKPGIKPFIRIAAGQA
jgi:WD40 repeat protein